jgi:hypothetical protein
MFPLLINGSIAVLTRPSVQTFEQHERDDLLWAMIYAVAGGAITGVVGAVMNIGNGVDVALGQLASGLFGTAIGSLIGWGIVWLLGRAFGGTGTFGQLAWGFSLYSTPLAVISGTLGALPAVGWIIAIPASLYGLYLSWLAVQSGMNLPSDKALIVIGILAAIALVIGCGIFGLLFVVFAAAGSY